MGSLSSLCPSLPSSMANLVQSVITLRSKQWGMMESYNSPPPPAEPADWSDEPVYYGPDGQQLTMEESEFLTDNLNDLILWVEFIFSFHNFIICQIFSIGILVVVIIFGLFLGRKTKQKTVMRNMCANYLCKKWA